ncbi:MAG: hypothetical protein J6M30_00880 [Bacteroidales bacterium]|nr:hypothetical protein [Bacteroidales bacterium]
MKRIKYLLFFAALILLVSAAHGQISYTSAVSAQRLNYYYSIDTSFAPKVMCVPDNLDLVITLAHETGNTNSLLFLTQEGTNVVNVVRISNYLITDFDIFYNYIVFCGESPSSPLYPTIIKSVGVEDYMSLFAGSSAISTMDLPSNLPFGKLKKIRAYQNDGIMKLAAITDSTYFLDIDWTNQYFDAFRAHSDLNDIIVTEDYVSVLGTISTTQCFIFAHDKNNMQSYNGNRFRTISKYLESKYFIEEMPGSGFYDNFTNGNQAFIGFMRDDLKDEFAIIDLNIMYVLDNFVVDSVSRHNILDLCHDNTYHTIHCLSRGVLINDYIYQPFPHNNYLMAVLPLDTIPAFNYHLKTITPHYNYFIAAGHCYGYGSSSNDAVYWFDSQINNYNSSCFSTKLLIESPATSFRKLGSLTYDYIYLSNILSPSTISSIILNEFYSYECQN